MNAVTSVEKCQVDNANIRWSILICFKVNIWQQNIVACDCLWFCPNSQIKSNCEIFSKKWGFLTEILLYRHLLASFQILQRQDITNPSPSWSRWTLQGCWGYCILGSGLCCDYKCWSWWFTWSREWSFCWDGAEIEDSEAQYADWSPW